MSDFNRKDGYLSGQNCYKRDWQGTGFAETHVREIALAFWQTDGGQVDMPPAQWLNEFVAGFIAAEEAPPERHTPIKNMAQAMTQFGGFGAAPNATPELMGYMRAMQRELGLPSEAELRQAHNPYADQYTAFMQELTRLSQARDTLQAKEVLSFSEQKRLAHLDKEIDLLVEQARSQGFLV